MMARLVASISMQPLVLFVKVYNNATEKIFILSISISNSAESVN